MVKELNLDADKESYTFLETIGKGSFGQVFKCIHKTTGLTVAIKTIDLEKAEDDLEDIQREIKILGQCDCKNVTKYYLSKIVGSELWIIMEYLGGGSVFDLLQMGVIDEVYVSVLMREILKGLIYLHGEGKIHRDIKCANILLSETGNVKLADFGVAGQLTDTFNKKNTFVGTPFWMAPEVIKQANYDFKADIWSLGITLFEMINGAPPYFEMHPMKALFSICKLNPPELSNSSSKSIREFFQLCVNKNPDFRPEAKVLIKHKFIKTAKKTSILTELIDRYKLFKLNDDSSQKFDDEDDYQDSKPSNNKRENLPDWIFETVKVAKNMIVTLDDEKVVIKERPNNLESLKTDNTVDQLQSNQIPSFDENNKNLVTKTKNPVNTDNINVSKDSLEEKTNNNESIRNVVSNNSNEKLNSLNNSLPSNIRGSQELPRNDRLNSSYYRKKSSLNLNIFKSKNKDKENILADDRKLSHVSKNHPNSFKKSENKLAYILRFLYESQIHNTPSGVELYNKLISDNSASNKIYHQIASFATFKK